MILDISIFGSQGGYCQTQNFISNYSSTVRSDGEKSKIGVRDARLKKTAIITSLHPDRGSGMKRRASVRTCYG